MVGYEIIMKYSFKYTMQKEMLRRGVGFEKSRLLILNIATGVLSLLGLVI